MKGLTSIQNKFFALLRFAIGTCNDVPTMTFADLKDIYEISIKQSLQAIILGGVQRLAKSAVILRLSDEDSYEELLMQWMGKNVVVARRNQKVNSNLVAVFKRFEHKGFECCLLKGQGNAQLYPHPQERVCGDIDVWLRTKKARRNEVIR